MNTKQPGLPRYARNDGFIGTRNDGDTSSSRGRRPWRSIALAALLPATVALPAQAQQNTSPLTLNAGYAVQTDSNLFRLPASANTDALLGQASAAENIGIASAGLSLNTTQSLQKFELDASLVDYRYRNFSYLSFTARNYDAAWHWAVTPRWTGSLTSERKETLNSFADYRAFNLRNQRTDTNTRLDTLYEITGPWRLVAGLAHTRQANQQALIAGGDYSSASADVGLRHAFGSGSTITYRARASNGSYLNRVLSAAGWYDDSFRQTDHDLRLGWVLNGSSTFDANLTHIKRSHPNFGQRDYSGFNTGASLNWFITGKSVLTAGYAHELANYETSYSSYSQTDRITLGPVWQISPKTLLRLRHVWSQIDYLGAPTAVASIERHDISRDTSLSFTWQPRQQLTVSAALQTASRGSNQAGLDYASNMASLSAQYSY